MEFAELIKIPRCDRIILRRPLFPNMPGTLCITSHHLIISSRTESQEELWLLHSSIDQLDSKQQGMTGGTLWLKCKDFRILTIDVIGADHFAKVTESISALSKIDNPNLWYPFFYQPMFTILEDGWSAFNPEAEFARLMQNSDEWRLSFANKEYKLCPTYPSVIIVPKGMDDAELTAVSNFRHSGRFPVLAYKHDKGGALLRGGQTMVTRNVKRCKEDEKLLSCVIGQNNHAYIIDTRTQNLAQSAKLRSGSYEGEIHYPNWKRLHKPIDRRQSLLDCLSKLIDAVNDTSCSMDKWLSRLESSGWMTCIKETLNCACLVAQCLDKENTSVLLNDVDGLDSTLIVSSLAQIILNPDCRTVRGLQALIEREWLLAGYPFGTRHNKSCYTPSSSRSKNNSPSFLLLLDCVHQIHSQFVCSFEFSESLLVFLMEHSYFSQFGTFLGDNEFERNRLESKRKTTSLWSYVNRPDVLRSYLNPMYEPNQSVIWPSVAPMSLQIWASVFLRWVVDQTPKQVTSRVVANLCEKDAELRSEAGKLRHHLHELEREAVNLGILSPAPSNCFQPA